jgi:hypothetical protein
MNPLLGAGSNGEVIRRSPVLRGEFKKQVAYLGPSVLPNPLLAPFVRFRRRNLVVSLDVLAGKKWRKFGAECPPDL